LALVWVHVRRSVRALELVRFAGMGIGVDRAIGIGVETGGAVAVWRSDGGLANAWEALVC